MQTPSDYQMSNLIRIKKNGQPFESRVGAALVKRGLAVYTYLRYEVTEAGEQAIAAFQKRKGV